MSTPGIVSLTEDNRVYAKVLSDCNGDRFLDLAVALNGAQRPSSRDLLAAAQEVGFGCTHCRVILCTKEPVQDESALDIPNEYWKNFTDPWTHPLHGKIGCSAVVEF